MSLDYTHACERAELLGLPVPTEQEWLETRPDLDAQPDLEEAVDDAAENLMTSDESAQRISGGLDELNSILSATQKKLNRFKTVCGSLSGILRVRSRGGTPDHKPTERRSLETNDPVAMTTVTDEDVAVELSEDGTRTSVVVVAGQPGSTVSRAKDINEKMGSHLDKLDSLINKAENAQYSMQHQRKQMARFLK